MQRQLFRHHAPYFQPCSKRFVMNTKYKFVDKVQLELKGGRGGNGCVSFMKLSPTKKRPSGGTGGYGGNIYIIADKSLSNLNFDTFHYHGGDGGHGGGDGMTGKTGKHIFIKVPIGTIIKEQVLVDSQTMSADEQWKYLFEDDDDDDNNTSTSMTTTSNQTINNGDNNDHMDENADEIDDEAEYQMKTLDLDTHNQMVLVCEGGIPGTGNSVMSGTNERRRRSMPNTKMDGQPGQQRTLLLELKLIADVGLVGFPNAGKSSLLKALSNAKPKIASYPFTTLHPNIGVVNYSDFSTVIVADIPGLINGAHENRGLGHDFLRHIERTKILLYVLDGAGTAEGERNPRDDLKALVHELKMYNEDMLKRPSLVFANKSDLASCQEHIEELSGFCRHLGFNLFLGSAENGDGMGELARELRVMVDRTRPAAKEELVADEEAQNTCSNTRTFG